MPRFPIAVFSFSLFITACGTEHAVTHGSAASASQGTAANLSLGGGSAPAAPSLDASQSNALAGTVSQILADFFNNLNGFPVGDFTSGAQNVSLRINCPLGGYAELTGSGQVSVGGTFLSPTGSLSNGNGSVNFSACVVPAGNISLTVNGVMAITGVSGTGSAAVSLSTATFQTSGSGAAGGSVSITKSSGGTLSCAINLTSNSNSGGTLTYSNMWVSGSGSAFTSGKVCNQTVNAISNFNI